MPGIYQAYSRHIPKIGVPDAFGSQMGSVDLAGPPRVNDNLQTCPTVYKSGTLVEVAPRAFSVCQSPDRDASLDHHDGVPVGISRYISFSFCKMQRVQETLF